jgi:hypothetical protein
MRNRCQQLLPASEAVMDTCQFFLEQYDTVRLIVNDLFLKGVNDQQMRHQPKEGLNSIAGTSGTRRAGRILQIPSSRRIVRRFWTSNGSRV